MVESNNGICYSHVKSFYSSNASRWVPAPHLVENRTAENWEEFVEICRGMFEANQPVKPQADLISPAIYGNEVYRADVNVSGWDLIFLDVDNENPALYLGHAGMEEFLQAFSLNYIIYNSPSSIPSAERYRVILPLGRAVEAGEIPRLWDAFYRFSGGMGDRACKDRSRAYYVPGQYPGCESSFFASSVAGMALDVDWLEGEYPEVPVVEAGSTGTITLADALRRRYSNAYHRSIFDSNIVTADILNDYFTNQDGNYHLGMYRCLCRIAGRAKTMGFPITLTDLAGIAREIDISDGGPFYKSADYKNKALDAMNYCGL